MNSLPGVMYGPPMRRALLVLLVASGVGLLAAPANAYQAQISRTSYGIPHVRAHSWGDLGFGAGYAFAEDNLCTLADEFVTVRAQRSRFFGPDGRTVRVGQGLRPQPRLRLLLAADQRPARGRAAGRAARRRAGRSREVRKLVRGYVAGYNAYLRSRGVARLPDPRCRGKAWVRPITALDLWRRYYQLGLIASGGQFVGDMVATQPPDGAAPARAASVAARCRRSLLARAPRPADRLERGRARAARRPRAETACCSATRTSRGSAPSASTSSS